jgi:putative holliday junction resolvase
VFDYFAIDWGTKKCGIAIGSSVTQLVTPKTIVPTPGLLDFVQQLLNEKPTLTHCVIGENKTFTGKPTQVSEASKKLQAQLQTTYPHLHVILYNERGTTQVFGKDLDQYAAAEILKNYFHYQL